mmetsp:Transcript_28801/g.66899  ORF Transcript_28801/g.66899 Transcript_28801/m.66899 type:complete len:294 (+) Transcript_28801:625-1506(+)
MMFQSRNPNANSTGLVMGHDQRITLASRNWDCKTRQPQGVVQGGEGNTVNKLFTRIMLDNIFSCSIGSMTDCGVPDNVTDVDAQNTESNGEVSECQALQRGAEQRSVPRRFDNAKVPLAEFSRQITNLAFHDGRSSHKGGHEQGIHQQGIREHLENRQEPLFQTGAVVTCHGYCRLQKVIKVVHNGTRDQHSFCCHTHQPVPANTAPSLATGPHFNSLCKKVAHSAHKPSRHALGYCWGVLKELQINGHERQEGHKAGPYSCRPHADSLPYRIDGFLDKIPRTSRILRILVEK